MLMADRFHRKFRSSPGKFSTGLSTDLWIGFDDTLTVDPARPSPRPRFSPYQSYAPEIPRYLCEDASGRTAMVDRSSAVSFASHL